MFLTYNGVSLDIENVLLYEKTPVYDPSGVDWLYTHHKIGVRAIWNPAATGTDFAAVAITALENDLMTPRKQLNFEVPDFSAAGNANNVVFSPLTFGVAEVPFVCDANNGPKPISFRIVSIVGQKTMICDYFIETWVKNCDSARPILSHRWQMSHHIDRDFFTTRIISGLAIFRTDWLNQPPVVGLSPDQFRGWLFHPVPNNYQRSQIQVELSADNTSLRYVITDEERRYNINQAWRSIIRADVTFSQFTGQVGVSWAALETAASAGTAIGGPVGGALAVAVAAALTVSFPKRRFQLNVRLQGRRNTPQLVFRAAAARIGASLNFGPQTLLGVPIPAVFFHTSYENFSLTSPYYESALVAEVSAEAQAFQNTFGVGPAAFSFQPNEVYTYNSGATSNPGGFLPSTSPTTNYGNRENLQLLVAQIFSDPCELPSRVSQTVLQPFTLPLSNPLVEVL